MTGFTEGTTDDPDRKWRRSGLYAAPEVLEGKTPTTLADIYALGVVLYQMVVGDLERALAPGMGARCRRRSTERRHRGMRRRAPRSGGLRMRFISPNGCGGSMSPAGPKERRRREERRKQARVDRR